MHRNLWVWWLLGLAACTADHSAADAVMTDSAATADDSDQTPGEPGADPMKPATARPDDDDAGKPPGPGATKPGGDKPGGDKPGGDKPDGDKPGTMPPPDGMPKDKPKGPKHPPKPQDGGPPPPPHDGGPPPPPHDGGPPPPHDRPKMMKPMPPDRDAEP